MKEVFFYCKINAKKLSNYNVNKFGKQVYNVISLLKKRGYNINLVEIGQLENDFINNKYTVKFSNFPHVENCKIVIKCY